MTKKQLTARLENMQTASQRILHFEDKIKAAEAQKDEALQARAKAYDEFRALLKDYGMHDGYSHEGAVFVLKAALYDAMQKEAKP